MTTPQSVKVGHRNPFNTVEPLLAENTVYSGHLVIADRFSRNRPNPGQTLIANPLYSGHFYSGHSL